MNTHLNRRIRELEEEVHYWKNLYERAEATIEAYRNVEAKQAAAAQEMNKLLEMLLQPPPTQSFCKWITSWFSKT